MQSGVCVAVMMELEVNELLFVNETDRRWVRVGFLVTARVIMLCSSIDTTILMQYLFYYTTLIIA